MIQRCFSRDAEGDLDELFHLSLLHIYSHILIFLTLFSVRFVDWLRDPSFVLDCLFSSPWAFVGLHFLCAFFRSFSRS